MFSETSLIWRLVTMNWLSFLNCANPGLFSLFSLTVCVQYKVFANDWIWTADFWSRKRLLYQLSHNHCLNRLSFKLGLFVVFRPLHNPMSLSMPQFWTWLIWCDFRVREISRSREKWKIRYCQVQKFGEKFGKNSK